jgi:hypothetical protein
VLSKDPLPPICYKYIESFDNLSVVPDNQYDKELRKILALVPDYKERQKEAETSWEENQPDYFRIATILCKKCGIQLKTINALDFGEDMVAPEIVQKNYEKQRWHYHIFTDKGYMYIVDDFDTVTLYKGDTHEVIDSMKIQMQEESELSVNASLDL